MEKLSDILKRDFTYRSAPVDEPDADERADDAADQGNDDEGDNDQADRFFDVRGLEPSCPNCKSADVKVSAWPASRADDPEGKTSGRGECNQCGRPFSFRYLSDQEIAQANGQQPE